MRRTLPLALLAALSLGCAAKSSTTTTTAAPSPAAPGATTTATPGPAGGPTTPSGDHSAPEAAIRTLYAHLSHPEDCDAILGDISAEGVRKATDKAGGRDKLCNGLRDSAASIVKDSTLVGVTTKKVDATTATVTLTITDKAGRKDVADVALVKEGDAWKLKELPT